MPTYQGQISEEGVIALVEYIKNLDSDYRIQQTTHDHVCCLRVKATYDARRTKARIGRGW